MRPFTMSRTDWSMRCFGLLCWPAIFAPVAGAFFHDYQTGPADLSSRRSFNGGSGNSAVHGAVGIRGIPADHCETYSEKTGIRSPFVAPVSVCHVRWAQHALPG